MSIQNFLLIINDTAKYASVFWPGEHINFVTTLKCGVLHFESRVDLTRPKKLPPTNTLAYFFGSRKDEEKKVLLLFDTAKNQQKLYQCFNSRTGHLYAENLFCFVAKGASLKLNNNA